MVSVRNVAYSIHFHSGSMIGELLAPLFFSPSPNVLHVLAHSVASAAMYHTNLYARYLADLVYTCYASRYFGGQVYTTLRRRNASAHHGRIEEVQGTLEFRRSVMR